MEERKLNEKESLELIAQMIQNSKKNLQTANGNILLLWGYLCTVTALVVYILTLSTDNPTWNWLWFAIPVIGYPITYWQLKKEMKPVLTYTDKVLKNIWKIIGEYGICVSISCALYFNTMVFILPMILILVSLGMCITGSIINDKFTYNCSGCGLAIGVITLAQILNPSLLDLKYPAFAFAFIIMMIIPGHRLNKEASKTSSENTSAPSK
ncbi:hypothetical protein [Phocaeicola faecalis]